MPAQKMAEPRLVGCGKTWFPGEDVLVHPGSRISVKKQPDIRTVCSELMRPAASAAIGGQDFCGGRWRSARRWRREGRVLAR